jgi:hypothetical protein
MTPIHQPRRMSVAAVGLLISVLFNVVCILVAIIALSK